MKKFTILKWALAQAAAVMMLTVQGFACTNFIIQAKDGAHIVGRSMEFGTILPTQIEVHPRGERNVSVLMNQQPGMNWTSVYAYIALTSFDSVVDGFNEQGLAFNALWFPDGVYPPLNTNVPKNKTLNFQDIGAWILGNFSTIDQVKEKLKNVAIYFHEIEALGQIPPLHMSIQDNNGKSLVVEFIEGQMHIFDNPIGVLTNAPNFPWQATNLRNYVNLSALNIGPSILEARHLRPTGQGTGLLGIPGDWTPPSRFVRTTVFKQFLSAPENASQAVNAAFHLLNTVDIPYGIVRGTNDKEFDYTQWATVVDLANRKLFFRTYNDLNIRMVDMAKEQLEAGSPVRKLALNGAPF